MKIEEIPFTVTTWADIPPVEHIGKTGKAIWRTIEAGNIRMRLVKYEPGYCADHWCRRGHVLLVLEGELMTELQDGRHFLLCAGMSYQVASDAEPHRSSTQVGATLFIVD
jgi:hypothetical protein